MVSILLFLSYSYFAKLPVPGLNEWRNAITSREAVSIFSLKFLVPLFFFIVVAFNKWQMPVCKCSKLFKGLGANKGKGSNKYSLISTNLLFVSHY